MTEAQNTFYVFNQADDEGYHAIKDHTGKIIATAADTLDQAYITLDEMGFNDPVLETIYNRKHWDNIKAI